MKKLEEFLIGLHAKKALQTLFVISLLCFYSPIKVSATNNNADTSISVEIQNQLSEKKTTTLLYYPQSVYRFYIQRSFDPIWIKIQKDQKKTYDALVLIDCVLQFGLTHDDYHPKELLYDRLNNILEHPQTTNTYQKARFEIMLTDALINFINNLHFGKLNPYYGSNKIDAGNIKGFNAEQTLSYALRQKDFISVLVHVQPSTKQYRDFQYQINLIKGAYTGDCSEIPGEDIQKIAINMERIRWANMPDSTFIHINIPSYTLKFHQPDTTYQFKVVVGKPSTPTPTLESTINYFTTAPEWRVPNSIFRKELLPKALRDVNYLETNHYAIYNKQGKYITPSDASLALIKQNPNNYYITQSPGCDNALGLVVFRFPNIYDIYLHDTPQQKYFKQSSRAYSHGCIRVEQAEKLARLILTNDGNQNKISDLYQAIAANQTKTFTLNKPLPIKITYLTCEVVNGSLVNYQDVYDLDDSLEMALYNTGQMQQRDN